MPCFVDGLVGYVLGESGDPDGGQLRRLAGEQPTMLRQLVVLLARAFAEPQPETGALRKGWRSRLEIVADMLCLALLDTARQQEAEAAAVAGCAGLLLPRVLQCSCAAARCAWQQRGKAPAWRHRPCRAAAAAAAAGSSVVLGSHTAAASTLEQVVLHFPALLRLFCTVAASVAAGAAPGSAPPPGSLGREPWVDELFGGRWRAVLNVLDAEVICPLADVQFQSHLTTAASCAAATAAARHLLRLAALLGSRQANPLALSAQQRDCHRGSSTGACCSGRPSRRHCAGCRQRGSNQQQCQLHPAS
ncbi:hypothetical protein ABPG75_009296 [Micractinium tetrahymenae]